MSISGIILSSLALLLVFLNAIMLNINSVPGENIVAVIGMVVVIAGIIVYALKEQIMSIHISGRWLRPVAVALAAVVVLIIALVQPWSVNPEGVIARAYSATEELLSYRTSSSIIYTHEGNTTTHSSEWEYMAPDRGHGKLNFGSEAFEFIIIGNTQYIRREADDDSGNIFSLSVSGSTHSIDEPQRQLL
ncbi:hypothetical protein ACFLWZ_08380 [Chloroflexota bacterium]